MRHRLVRRLPVAAALLAALALAARGVAAAQHAPAASPPGPAARSDAILLTLFLGHDPSRPLGEREAQRKERT